MSDHRFRCGDIARIEGTDYDIEVAYADYESGQASWCGWPDGTVEIAKLALVHACSDDEHRAAVSRWLDWPRSIDHVLDHRRDVIDRLYRPRGYWQRAWRSAGRDVEAARARARACYDKFCDAHNGPPDVEPIVVAPAPDQEEAVAGG